MRLRFFSILIFWCFLPCLSFGKVQWQSFTQKMMNGDYEYTDSHMVFKSFGQQDSVHLLFDLYRNRISSVLLGKPVYTYSFGNRNMLFNLTTSSIQQGDYNNQIQETEVCAVQISDGIKFVILRLGANASGEITSVGLSSDVYDVPDTKKMWLVGIPIILLLLLFKVYVCIRIFKSDVTKKWVKYLLILLVNIPVLGYHAVNGFFFSLFRIDILGFGYGTGNYLDTYWAIGLPIGAMIVLWRLNNGLYRTKEDDWIYDIETNQRNDQQ